MLLRGAAYCRGQTHLDASRLFLHTKPVSAQAVYFFIEACHVPLHSSFELSA